MGSCMDSARRKSAASLLQGGLLWTPRMGQSPTLRLRRVFNCDKLGLCERRMEVCKLKRKRASCGLARTCVWHYH